MKTTKNYGLIKPEPAEYYDVEQFNQNMDVLDEKIKEIAKETTDFTAHVGSKNNPHGIAFFCFILCCF